LLVYIKTELILNQTLLDISVLYIFSVLI
jgi:hypothetical protein